MTSLVIDATILNVAVFPSITPWFCGCVWIDITRKIVSKANVDVIGAAEPTRETIDLYLSLLSAAKVSVGVVYVALVAPATVV